MKKMPRKLEQWVEDNVICHFENESGEESIMRCTQQPANKELKKLINIALELIDEEWSDEAMEDCECIPCFKGEDDE